MVIDLSKILNDIFICVVPGYIIVGTFYFLTSRKHSEHKLIFSVVISYMLEIFLRFFKRLIMPNRIFVGIEKSFILILSAIICSIIVWWLIRNEKILKMFVWATEKSFYNDIISEVLPYGKSAMVSAKHGNIEYIGGLSFHEEKGSNSILVLNKYQILENDEIINDMSHDPDAYLLIKIADMDHVEIFKDREGIDDNHEE